jgi:hypothetical protein
MSVTRITQPPRWMNRLLQATGADPEFRDDVLGDMADEFMIRLAYDGEDEARRWYVREGLRTLPHLARNWLMQGPRAPFGYLARTVLKAYGLTSLVAGVAFGIVSAVLATTGASHDANGPALFIRVLGLPGFLALAMSLAVFGGFTAARLGKRAPFACAIGLGAFWSGLAIAGSAIVFLLHLPVFPPLTWLAAEAALVMLGTTLGGVWRVCTAD